MIKLDDDLLQELGLAALPPEEKKKMLAHIYETLEMRVGMKLAEQMTDAQLDEFEQFINRNDEAGALRWLEANFPHYKDVVAQEFEQLKMEIRQVAPQILASAGAQAAGPQQQMPQPQHQTQAVPDNVVPFPGQPQQPMRPQYQQPMHQPVQQPYQYPGQHQQPPQAPPSMPYAA